MAGARYRLTAPLVKDIVAFIRAGGFAHVAAEASGLPREVFIRWLARGEQRQAPAKYRAFARAIRQAEAQARLHAETTIRTDKPLDWLKCGPGKESADHPGWTNPGKPGSTTDKRDRAQEWGDILHLLGRCAEQLAAFPDARTALAAWLTQLSSTSEK